MNFTWEYHEPSTKEKPENKSLILFHKKKEYAEKTNQLQQLCFLTALTL